MPELYKHMFDMQKVRRYSTKFRGMVLEGVVMNRADPVDANAVT